MFGNSEYSSIFVIFAFKLDLKISIFLIKMSTSALSNIDKSSLAIIIVNWKLYEVTANCLKSLRFVVYDNFKIILVDNGSEDLSGEKLKANFPEVVLLKNEENRGFTGGNNTGIQYALESGFELIMLLNNDTVVTPNFATILINKLQSDDRVGAIQPKIMFNQEKDIIWSGGSLFFKTWYLNKSVGVGEKDIGQYDMPKELPWVTGCCFLTKSSIVKEVGLLDDRFFMYYEDMDWSFRIRGKGYKLLYEPMAKIYHEVGKSNENTETFGEGNLSPFSHYVNVRNHIFIVRRYADGVNYITAIAFQLVKITGYCLYFLFKRRPKKLKASLRGFYHGFKYSI
ncbi:MAG: GT2 family glycosyltransferase [Roseivirga sp.]|jgi:GT2 family glycosyltransferase